MKTLSIIFLSCLLFLCLAGRGEIITVPGDESTIQAAIDVADHGDTVLLSPGNFRESLNFHGKNIMLTSYFLTTHDSTYIEQTIIDGRGDGKAIVMVSGETRSAVIYGITITNGSGGIYLYHSDPTIRKVVIRNNSAVRGGGICGYFAGPLLEDVLIYDNEASLEGGGIYFKKGDPVIRNCVFLDNEAEENGGAIFLQESEAEMHDLLVQGNDARSGAGMYLVSSGVNGENLKYTFNIADISGGGIYLDAGNLVVSDLYMFQNTAWSGKGGGICGTSTDLQVSGARILSGSGLQGGGIYLQASSGVFDSIEIHDNHAITGGGVFCRTSDPLITGANITENSAQKGAGFCSIDSSPVMENTSIEGNEAYDSGGGISLEYSTPSFNNVKVAGNEAERGGGAFILDSDPDLRDVELSGNTAEDGAGLYCLYSDISLDSVRVRDNVASGMGGGLYCNRSVPEFYKVTISNNTALTGGGIYCTNNSSPVFCPMNLCNVYLNKANNGSDLYSECPFEVIVDTFSVLHPTDHHARPVENFSFNILNKKIDQVSSNLFVSVEGSDSNSGLSPGTALRTLQHAKSIMYNDGMHENTIFLMEGTYRAGDEVGLFPLYLMDHVSLKGFYGQEVTLDAEGLSNVLVLHDDQDVSLQNLTITGATGAGVLVENSSVSMTRLKILDNSGSGIVCQNSSVSITGGEISNNRSVTGGGIYCSDSELSMAGSSVDRNWSDQKGGGLLARNSKLRISDCDFFLNNSAQGAGIFANGSVISIHHCMVKNNSAEGNGGGMTIDGGRIEMKNSELNENKALHGGGIFTMNTFLSMEKITMNGNRAQNKGGAIYTGYSEVMLMDVSVTFNHAAYGGGLFLDNSTPLLAEALVSGNVASDGGGIFCRSSDLVLENARIVYNYAYDEGGGMHCRASDTRLTNVLVSENFAYRQGGGLFYFRSDPELNNVTLSYNESGEKGGGVYLWNECHLKVSNSIMWDNDRFEIYIAPYLNVNQVTVSFSCLEGGEEGIFQGPYGIVDWLKGNIDENPRFTYAGYDPYQLSAGSPCVDRGNPDLGGMYFLSKDLLGNPRIMDGDGNGKSDIDMGAYEAIPLRLERDAFKQVAIEETPAAETRLWSYPNPVINSGTIKYELEASGIVQLSLCDIKGNTVRMLVDARQQAGSYEVSWDAGNLASGIYICLLVTNGEIHTQKVRIIH